MSEKNHSARDHSESQTVLVLRDEKTAIELCEDRIKPLVDNFTNSERLVYRKPKRIKLSEWVERYRIK